MKRLARLLSVALIRDIWWPPALCTVLHNVEFGAKRKPDQRPGFPRCLKKDYFLTIMFVAAEKSLCATLKV